MKHIYFKGRFFEAKPPKGLKPIESWEFAVKSDKFPIEKARSAGEVVGFLNSYREIKELNVLEDFYDLVDELGSNCWDGINDLRDNRIHLEVHKNLKELIIDIFYYIHNDNLRAILNSYKMIIELYEKYFYVLTKKDSIASFSIKKKITTFNLESDKIIKPNDGWWGGVVDEVDHHNISGLKSESNRMFHFKDSQGLVAINLKLNDIGVLNFALYATKSLISSLFLMQEKHTP